MKTSPKTIKRERRHRRIRAKAYGTADKPRLAVYKSNTAVFAQLIDDEKGVTIAAISSSKVKAGKTVSEKAFETGKEIANLAHGKKIKKVVFDRGGFIYTGKIKAVADGAREAGLSF
jgi:large subunit ribosomal protein L18